MRLVLPNLQENESGHLRYTHNHAIRFSFSAAGKRFTCSELMQARQFFEASKNEVKSCMFFAKNYLKGQELTGEQIAVLSCAIDDDEKLIKSLNKAKPCTIL